MPADKLGQGRVTLDVDFVGLREVSEKLDQLIAATKNPAPAAGFNVGTTGVESPANKRTVVKRNVNTGAYAHDSLDPYDPAARKWVWAREWTPAGLTLYRYNGKRDVWETLSLVGAGGVAVQNAEWVPIPSGVGWRTANSVFTRVGPNA